jgi:hypothetical protein
MVALTGVELVNTGSFMLPRVPTWPLAGLVVLLPWDAQRVMSLVPDITGTLPVQGFQRVSTRKSESPAKVFPGRSGTRPTEGSRRNPAADRRRVLGQNTYLPVTA